MATNTVADGDVYWLLTDADGSPKCFRFQSEGPEVSAYLAARNSATASVAARRCGGTPRAFLAPAFMERLLAASVKDAATGVMVLTRAILETCPKYPPVITFDSLLNDPAVNDLIMAVGESLLYAPDGQNRVVQTSCDYRIAAARWKMCEAIVPVLDAAVRARETGVEGSDQPTT